MAPSAIDIFPAPVSLHSPAVHDHQDHFAIEDATPVEDGFLDSGKAVQPVEDGFIDDKAVHQVQDGFVNTEKIDLPVQNGFIGLDNAVQPIQDGFLDNHTAPPVQDVFLDSDNSEMEDAILPEYQTLQSVAASVVKPLSGATKLRKMLLETNELVVCPGVYDGLSARTALEVGFDALYMTGAGTTASRLGQPDLAIAQLYEMRENADMIAGLDPYGPPLIADMDTGYGGPLLVARTVEQYIRSGVAGAHLEDQVLMKRCGHLGGKKVVPREEYMQRIRAAHQARLRLQSDFVLIARTDALQSMGYDECIARLREARDIGADVGLLEGFKTREQAAQAVKDLAPWPLMYNSVENGASPTITVDEARQMGFRIMVFSFATLAPAYTGIRDALHKLKNFGRVGTAKEITPVKLFEVCGLNHSMAVDTASGGTAFAEDVGKV